MATVVTCIETALKSVVVWEIQHRARVAATKADGGPAADTSVAGTPAAALSAADDSDTKICDVCGEGPDVVSESCSWGVTNRLELLDSTLQRLVASDPVPASSDEDDSPKTGEAESGGVKTCVGYPCGDLVALLAARLARWRALGEFPLAFSPMAGLTEHVEVVEGLRDGSERIVAAVTKLADVSAAWIASEPPSLAMLSRPSIAAGTAVTEGSNTAIEGEGTGAAEEAASPPGSGAGSGAGAGSGSADTASAAEAAEPVVSLPRPSNEVATAVVALLEALQQERGLMVLLGMRRTVGSVDLLVPPRSALLAAFQQVHKPSTSSKHRLTVGGRAHAKHAHRSGDGWWGASTGSESAKNERALGVVTRILDGAVWMNIHLLPHDLRMLEMRVAEGYGARWTADGSSFRGFLEPVMADGHANKWRH